MEYDGNQWDIRGIWGMTWMIFWASPMTLDPLVC